jgi:hypothetical protein
MTWQSFRFIPFIMSILVCGFVMGGDIQQMEPENILIKSIRSSGSRNFLNEYQIQMLLDSINLQVSNGRSTYFRSSGKLELQFFNKESDDKSPMVEIVEQENGEEYGHNWTVLFVNIHADTERKQILIFEIGGTLKVDRLVAIYDINDGTLVEDLEGYGQLSGVAGNGKYHAVSLNANPILSEDGFSKLLFFDFDATDSSGHQVSPYAPGAIINTEYRVQVYFEGRTLKVQDSSR